MAPESVGPEVPGMYGLCHSHTTIVMRNKAEESVEWVVKCVAYGGTDIILDVDGVYYLKGRVVALNNKDIQKFYHEPDFQLLANTSATLNVGTQVTFEVKYWVMWSKLMEKLQPLMTVGREVMLTQHIVGRNEERQMWIMQVTGVSVTSGLENFVPTAQVDRNSTRTMPWGQA
ncbi:uncharacterized protein MELLADRAFT_103652 [Melampsora larici-populina 98AG31]|uniref:Uncharacterized protein n=1 Tax=Melampsora larici-populina (strain 98AG31 / pathotype 3-4-7) TaxID=747676 RepID=F4RC12_MELLP|nr:uncharacterized protein MELLADRAFT_103652 [Melampsora larici-populina 98AG31]EGG10198.1 hypothetical protein MELLADRAFT_103652 [Melampsora larici-populina 98AG31]